MTRVWGPVANINDLWKSESQHLMGMVTRLSWVSG